MSVTKVREAWLEQRADWIEQTCQAGRCPVDVRGGTVTSTRIHFYLAPAPATRPDRLLGLAPDLSAVLDAPARLVRDNGRITLTIPRPAPPTIDLVKLQAGLPPLSTCTALLGRSEEGNPLLLRLSNRETGHVLIAGTRGAGKTTLVRAILTSLALANEPDDLRLLLVDPRGHSFAPFSDLPHLFGQVLREASAIERRLTWLAEEMIWRRRHGVRTPRVVVAIDEVADLLVGYPELEAPITRLAVRGGEAGIHLLLCTQEPTAPAIGRLLKDNVPCRIVGQVADAREAAAATGVKGSGAEYLRGQGDFLLAAGGEVLRFQAASIDTGKIAVMVEMFQEEGATGPCQCEEEDQ